MSVTTSTSLFSLGCFFLLISLSYFVHCVLASLVLVLQLYVIFLVLAELLIGLVAKYEVHYRISLAIDWLHALDYVTMGVFQSFVYSLHTS